MTELFRIFRDGIAAVLLLISQHEYLALFGIVPPRKPASLSRRRATS